MGVWDEKIAPKGGGTANAQFRFSVSHDDSKKLRRLEMLDCIVSLNFKQFSPIFANFYLFFSFYLAGILLMLAM